MVIEKDNIVQKIIEKFGIDKEDNQEKVKFNNKDTNRDYQVRLAKEIWNEDISINDKYWYPEDSYYMNDALFKGFKKLKTIKYSNIKEYDKVFLKFGEWRKRIQIYYNEKDKKVLFFVNYEICNNKEWDSSIIENFIGIFDND